MDGSEATTATRGALAVTAIHIRTADACGVEAFWRSILGKPYDAPYKTPAGKDGGLSELLGNGAPDWDIGLAMCGVPDPWLVDQAGEVRCAGTGASELPAALDWLSDGLSSGRFRRAVLLSTRGDGPDRTEVGIAFRLLDAARAEGERCLAVWSPAGTAADPVLVTAAGGSASERAGTLRSWCLPPGGALPSRSLWLANAAGREADAQDGMTALVVAVLAIAYRIVPPTRGSTGLPESDPLGFGRFSRARPWLAAPGAGGRTAMCVLSAADRPRALILTDAEPDGPSPLALTWPAQLLVLSADDAAGLLAAIAALEGRLAAEPAIALDALAPELWARPHRVHRCAVVATHPQDLAAKLAVAARRIEGEGRNAVAPRERVFAGASRFAGTPLAVVIPGQGAQYAGMLRDACLAFPEMRRHFEWSATARGDGEALLPLLYPADEGAGADARDRLSRFWGGVAESGAVSFAASQALYEMLRGFGLRPDFVAGHSIGESAALVLTGAFAPPAPDGAAAMMRELNRLITGWMTGEAGQDSAGVAVNYTDRAALEEAMRAHAGEVFLALDNCPHQAVLLGRPQAIEAIAGALRGTGATCLPLALGAPFHTPLFAPAIASVARFYETLDVRAPDIPVWSCAANAAFPEEPAGIRAMALRQWVEPVRFTEAVRTLHDKGVRIFVEVGPGETLSGFIRDSLAGRDHLAVACDSQWFGGVEHLLALLGQLYVAGIDLAPVVQRNAASAPAAESAAQGAEIVAATIDPTAIAAGHFTLMQEFLESQARVAALAALAAEGEPGAAALAAPRARVASAPPFPALGPASEHGDGMLSFVRRVSVDSDPYFADHVFGRADASPAGGPLPLPVMPFVMMLETVAEAGLAAASRERPGLVVAGIERLRCHRWIALDRGDADLVVEARLRPSDEASPLPGRRHAEVQLFEIDEAAPLGRWLVAEGVVEAAAGFDPSPAARQLSGPPADYAMSSGAFCEKFIFQGPGMRSFRRMLRVTADGIEAELVVPPRDRLFAGQGDPALATGANLLDAAGQIIGGWLSLHWSGWYGFYPFSVDGFRQYGPPPRPGEIMRCIALVAADATTASADVEFLRADGTLLYRYRTFKQRRFAWTAALSACFYTPDAGSRFSEPLATGVPGVLGCAVDGGYHDLLESGRAIFLQAVAHNVLSARERRTWLGLPRGGPRRGLWLLGRVAAKEVVQGWARERHGQRLRLSDIEIEPDPLGKPHAVIRAGGMVAGPVPGLSISHSERVAVAVIADAGDVAVGVDIEGPRQPGAAMPGSAFEPGELAEAESLGVAPLALWCAKEAAAKVLGTGLLGDPRRWRVHDIAADGRSASVSIGDTRIAIAWGSLDGAVIAVGHMASTTAARERQRLARLGIGSSE